ncbi:MAG TPA: proprotein convertase P-domain-containing protein, partial [Bacteroidales bacterium]|nr:proprotein convertase P-domain-containing protein [Bacteroidales bacterium]
MNKTKYIIAAIAMLLSVNIFAQTYTLNNVGTGQTGALWTCTGTLYDSGGTSNYSNNESFTSTICSDNGSTITLHFTQFNTQSGNDFLTICDGPNSDAPVVVSAASGTSLNGQTITSTGNCLTLLWTSNASTTAAGFAATISCGLLCQGFYANITSTNPPISNADSVWINICQGQTVNFTANGDYPNNGSQGYSQSNSNVDFFWYVVDGENDTITSHGLNMTNFSYTFNEEGGYRVVLYARDQIGCWNMNYQLIRIRVSITPNFTGTDINPDPICPGQPVNLNGEVIPNDWHAELPEISAGVTFLPDGNGSVYTTCLNYTIFNPGQTLPNAQAIEGICLNMEHSYLGDLDVIIRCPNGTQVYLKQYSGGGGCFVGEPIDNDGNLNPGDGYEYCFTANSPQYGTWEAEANSHFYTFTDNAGTTYTNHNYLPAGTYASEQSLNGLAGCPLNGEWCIIVKDNLSIDNGYIFHWGLEFDPSLYPADFWVIENSFTGGAPANQAWSGPNITSQSNGDGVAAPTLSGNVAYTFTATDNFGCSYDTTVTVTVLPANDPTCCVLPTNVNAGADNAVCSNTYNLTGSAVGGTYNGFWSMVSGPGTASFGSITSANSSVTVSLFGTYVFAWTVQYQGNSTCQVVDNVSITFNQTFDPTITEIEDMCLSHAPVQVTAVDVGTLTCPTCPAGSFDAASAIFTPTAPGSYTITNTITGPCVGTGSSSTTFVVFDELEIVNFNDQECIYGTDPVYVTEWDMQGSTGAYTGNYYVNGALTSGHFEQTHPSATSYAYTITDMNGCTSIPISGFRDCDCPSAGTMTSLQLEVLCQGECTGTVVGHNGNQVVAPFPGAIFEFMIHTGNNVPIAYSATTNFCPNFPGFSYNTTYYISAIAGFDNNGDGHPELTGCYSVAVGTPVMWYVNPTPYAGIDRDTCGLVIRMNGSAIPDGMVGYWSSTCQFFPMGGTSVGSPNMLTMVNNCANCTFTWHVVNGQCDGSDDMNVNFRCTPNPFAGNDTTVCGNEITLNGNQSISGSNISWSGNGMTFTQSTTVNPTARITTYGTYQIIITEQNGSCWDQDQVNVTFIQGPTPSVTLNHDTVCGTIYKLQVYNVNGPGIWRAYDNGVQVFPTFINGTNSSNPVAWVAVPAYTGLAKTYDFCWNETSTVNGVQCNASVCIGVTFAREPSASVGQDDHDQVCGDMYTFAADTLGSGWAFGTWVAKDIICTFDDINSPNATVDIDELGSFGDTAHVEVQFLWVMNNYGCTAIDTMYVTFYTAPVANAGINDSICGF